MYFTSNVNRFVYRSDMYPDVLYNQHEQVSMLVLYVVYSQLEQVMLVENALYSQSEQVSVLA